MASSVKKALLNKLINEHTSKLENDDITVPTM
jgi:hypothetical protein